MTARFGGRKGVKKGPHARERELSTLAPRPHSISHSTYSATRDSSPPSSNLFMELLFSEPVDASALLVYRVELVASKIVGVSA